MSFVIFPKFDEMENLFPKLDVSINTKGDDQVPFGRNDDIIDNILMHVANFVVFGRGKGGEQEIMKVEFPEFAWIGSNEVLVLWLLISHFIREVFLKYKY